MVSLRTYANGYCHCLSASEAMSTIFVFNGVKRNKEFDAITQNPSILYETPFLNAVFASKSAWKVCFGAFLLHGLHSTYGSGDMINTVHFYHIILL